MIAFNLESGEQKAPNSKKLNYRYKSVGRGISLFNTIALILISFIITNTAYAQIAKDDSEFIFVVVEFTKQTNGNIEAVILNHRVVEGRVKKPTKSKNLKKQSKDDIIIEILDLNGALTDRIVIEDPLAVPIRVPGGTGDCHIVETQLEKFPIMVRRPLSKNATQMTIRRNDNKKTVPLTNIKLR